MIDLRSVSGYKQRAATIRWAKHNGISYFLDKDRNPVTTQKALDRALIGSADDQQYLPRFLQREYADAAEVPRQARRHLLCPPK